MGSYKELLANGNDFAEFFRTYHNQNEQSDVIDDSADDPAVSSTKAEIQTGY